MRAVSVIIGLLVGGVAGFIAGSFGDNLGVGLLSGAVAGGVVAFLFSLAPRAFEAPSVAVESFAPAGLLGGVMASVTANAGWVGGFLSCGIGWGCGLVLPIIFNESSRKNFGGNASDNAAVTAHDVDSALAQHKPRTESNDHAADILFLDPNARAPDQSVLSENPEDDVSMIDEDAAYALAWKEVENSSFEPGAWGRAYADSSGDKNKTKAAYIKYRVPRLLAELRDQRESEIKKIRKEALLQAEQEDKKRAQFVNNFLAIEDEEVDPSEVDEKLCRVLEILRNSNAYKKWTSQANELVDFASTHVPRALRSRDRLQFLMCLATGVDLSHEKVDGLRVYDYCKREHLAWCRVVAEVYQNSGC